MPGIFGHFPTLHGHHALWASGFQEANADSKGLSPADAGTQEASAASKGEGPADAGTEGSEGVETVDTGAEMNVHASDPRIPRKLLPKFRLMSVGARDFGPFGLRVVSGRLYVCDSDDDAVLSERGRCGMAGTRWQINDTALRNKKDSLWILPVRRWDPEKQTWTAEKAPHVSLPEWTLPLVHDGKVDLEAIPAMPRQMTRHSPGEIADPLEASMAPLWHLMLSTSSLAHMAPHVLGRVAAGNSRRWRGCQQSGQPSGNEELMREFL